MGLSGIEVPPPFCNFTFYFIRDWSTFIILQYHFHFSFYQGLKYFHHSEKMIKQLWLFIWSGIEVLPTIWNITFNFDFTRDRSPYTNTILQLRTSICHFSLLLFIWLGIEVPPTFHNLTFIFRLIRDWGTSTIQQLGASNCDFSPLLFIWSEIEVPPPLNNLEQAIRYFPFTFTFFWDWRASTILQFWLFTFTCHLIRDWINSYLQNGVLLTFEIQYVLFTLFFLLFFMLYFHSSHWLNSGVGVFD